MEIISACLAAVLSVIAVSKSANYRVYALSDLRELFQSLNRTFLLTYNGVRVYKIYSPEFDNEKRKWVKMTIYYIESTNDIVIAKVLAWLKLRHEGYRPKRKGIAVGKCSQPTTKVEYRDENFYRPWDEDDFYADNLYACGAAGRDDDDSFDNDGQYDRFFDKMRPFMKAALRDCAYIDCDEDDDEEEQEDENEHCDIEFRPDDLEFDELNDNFEESPFSFD